jgi:glutaredoxin
MIKKFLKLKNMSYNEVDLDEHPGLQAEAFKLSGVMSVPVIVIVRDEKQSVLVGYNLAKLAPALA